MSQFYGTLDGQARTVATRRGSKKSGITATAASWSGAVRVSVSDEDGEERFDVYMVQWHGRGECKLLATGVIGKPETVKYQ